MFIGYFNDVESSGQGPKFVKNLVFEIQILLMWRMCISTPFKL